MKTKQLVDSVVQQIDDLGEVRCEKKGEAYTVFLNDKPVMIAKNEKVYVKSMGCLAEFMQYASTEFAMDDEDEYYILNTEDEEETRRIIGLVEMCMPVVNE